MEGNDHFVCFCRLKMWVPRVTQYLSYIKKMLSLGTGTLGLLRELVET